MGLNDYLLLNLSSNKYFLSKNTKSFLFTRGYDFIAKFGDVGVFKNQHYIPLGFTYDKYILNQKFREFSSIEKEIILQKACVIEDTIVAG